ncbi:unnamed protein product [Rhizoctonia solani]|uniref:Transmembrane protein n=1 Tax=Rhizoctonia solani TaxID=456999 RepID=A0A8H2X6J2_9AGAM|nr:unnamed protein product [Rhizoctonia solani]
MKLAPLLLAAPVVFTMVAADPRPGPERRVLDRWQFARQDTTSAGGGAGTTAAAATTTAAAATTTREAATSTTPTSTPAAETTSTPAQPTSTSSPSSQQPVQESTTTPTSSRQQTPTSTSNTPQQQPTSAAATSANQPASSQAPQQSSQTTPTTTSYSLSTPPPTTAVVSTTDQHGNVVTSYVIFTPAPTSVVASASSTAAAQKTGVSQSTVIGLAVTGSIAGLLIILLIVWKLTSKRFSDLDDNEDDAIKWPELNKDSAAMTPIPARPSTRAGGTETDTLGGDFDRQSAVNSTADLSYAPYSDDPGYGARPAYYDPYGAAPGATKLYPSPPGSHDGDHKNWGGPADAQYYDAPRVASPGPNAIARGMSPGPGMAYDARVASPAPPNMAYADPVGRTGSPGPAGGYGYGAAYAQPDPYGGRHSPGPNMAYGQAEDPYGRRSPGPGMAYGASVGRVASPGPGPNAGYR